MSQHDLALAQESPLYDVLKYWTQFAKDIRTYVRTYGRTYGRTTPSLCLGTPVPRQKTNQRVHVIEEVIVSVMINYNIRKTFN